MLHLSPDDFWRATPHELSAALEMIAEVRGGAGTRRSGKLGADDVAELQAMLKGAP